MLEHIRRGKHTIGELPMHTHQKADGQHYVTLGFLFTLTRTLPAMKEANWIAKAVLMYAFNADYCPVVLFRN